MPRLEFERYDLPIAIGRGAAGDVVMRAGAGAALRAAAIAPAGALDPGSLEKLAIEALFHRPPIAAFVRRSPPPSPNIQTIYRVALEIEDPDLEAIDWERVLKPAAAAIGYPGDASAYPPTWTLVRVSRVRPRFATLPLTLPLRFLQVHARPGHEVPTWVRSVFGGWPDERVNRAAIARVADGWRAPASWPTVDVLHIDSLPSLEDEDLALSTAEPDREGTLGWLARWTERWQTRLLVLHCETDATAGVARRLARALCDKGGPAMLVAAPTAGAPGPDLPSFYRAFYDQLIHDFALDWIVGPAASGDVSASLFAGSEREEGVRPSSVGVALVAIADRLGPLVDFSVQPLTSLDLLRGLAGSRDVPDAALPRLASGLVEMRNKWERYTFNLHEGDGLLPLADELHGLRASIASGTMRSGTFPGSTLESAPSLPPRFVNGSLWSERSGRAELLPQSGAVLTTGETCQLGLQIGPKDERIVTLNPAAIFEEVFKWAPGVEGVWIEFAVTGIDFTVIGDPVQEVWLPREGATDPVYFAVRPDVSGVAQLRYGLYYGHNLIQSFRLAAITTPRDVAAPGSPHALARALDVSAGKVGTYGYLSRLEYSRTTAFENLGARSARALSISANDLGGRAVLTIKGPGVMAEHVRVAPDDEMPQIVKQIRTALGEITYATAPGGALPQYQFGPYTTATDLDERFDKAMVKLASAGVRLYTNVAPGPKTQRALAGCLGGERKVIQVAPLLRKKVVPWAFVYDRLFDEGPTIIGGVQMAHGVCRAALPNGDEKLAAIECGTHADCLLNPARQADRHAKGQPPYHERTVACPLHFWGFRHVIEAPSQQVEDEDEDAREETTRIAAAGGVKLVAGLNATLGTHAAHWTSLLDIRTWDAPEYDRAHLLDRLRSADLDFIYFFCHARGGEEDATKTDPPYLEFQPAGAGAPDQIRPQDFADPVQWTHGPLVFLNACGTLGYSPDALSPFLKALVNGRGAAGVLGTEVPVAEILAGEVARRFIERFVKGEAAGGALLDVRRELLGRKNPLGLVYTLFAPAELAVDLH